MMSLGCNFINTSLSLSKINNSSSVSANQSKPASSSSDATQLTNRSGNEQSNRSADNTIQAGHSGQSQRCTNSNVNNVGDLNNCHSLATVDCPINLDSISQLDLDQNRLEDECLSLQRQVEYWEREVEMLERKRCTDNFPAEFVEDIVKQRKKLRDLEAQIYRLNLDSDEAEQTCQVLST